MRYARKERFSKDDYTTRKGRIEQSERDKLAAYVAQRVRGRDSNVLRPSFESVQKWSRRGDFFMLETSIEVSEAPDERSQ